MTSPSPNSSPNHDWIEAEGDGVIEKFGDGSEIRGFQSTRPDPKGRGLEVGFSLDFWGEADDDDEEDDDEEGNSTPLTPGDGGTP